MLTRILAAGALFACFALLSCASVPQYGARTPGGSGFSEARIDNQHWLVQYAGEPSDTREIVERNLLFRSAELTLRSGYNWFAPSNHATNVEIVVYGSQRSPSASAGSSQPTDDMGRHGSSVPLAPPPSYDRFVSHQIITMGLGKGPPDSFHAASVWALLSQAVEGQASE